MCYADRVSMHAIDYDDRFRQACSWRHDVSAMMARCEQLHGLDESCLPVRSVVARECKTMLAAARGCRQEDNHVCVWRAGERT